MKKTLFSLLLAALLAAPAIFADTFCDGGTFIRGDVNCDGDVDVSDLVFLGNYLYQSGSAPTRLDSGDFDDDGDVGVTDLTLLGYFLYQSGDPPCCPYPDEDKDTVGAEVGDDLDNCVSQPSDVTLTLTGDEMTQASCPCGWAKWPETNCTEEFCGEDDNEAHLLVSDGGTCESVRRCGLWTINWDVADDGGFTIGRLSNQIQDAAFSMSGTVDFIVSGKCGSAPPNDCPDELNYLLAGFNDAAAWLHVGPASVGEATKTLMFLFDASEDIDFVCEYSQTSSGGTCVLDKCADCNTQHVVATVAAEFNITDELISVLEGDEAPECEEWKIYGVDVNNIETLFSLDYIDQAFTNAIDIHLVPLVEYVYHGCDEDNFEVVADYES